MTKEETEQVHTALRDLNKYWESQIINTVIDKISPNEYKISIPYPTRKFITDVMITELLDVAKKSPWLGFVSIGSGIEFLGKCIDPAPNAALSWDVKGRSRDNFNDAIKNLNGIKKYTDLINRADGFKIYEEFRCGLTHGLAPKGLSLSHGTEEEQTYFKSDSGRVNFNIDELYADFKLACEDVIGRTYPDQNKMNMAKVSINLTIKFPASA